MMFAELKLKTTGRDISSPAQLQREYENKTLTEEEWNEIKGKYAVIVQGWKQYAEGITGQNHWNDIWLNNNCVFFDTREEAEQFCKECGKKSYNKKGGRDIGYGSVGSASQRVKILKLSKSNLNKYFAFESYIISPSWRSNG